MLISNLVTICLAVSQNWNVTVVIWIYWFQSITIGFFNLIRILALQDFRVVENEELVGLPPFPSLANERAPSKRFIQISSAVIFSIHFGAVHFAYFMLLMKGTFARTFGNVPNRFEWQYILLAAVLFFMNHLFSYLHHRPQERIKSTIGPLMFYPYVRVLPMQFVLGLSLTAAGALPFFLVLKTLADCIMHLIEHAVLRGGGEQRT